MPPAYHVLCQESGGRANGNEGEKRTAGVVFSDPGRVVLRSIANSYSRVIPGFPAVVASITPRPAAITKAMAIHVPDTR